MASDSVTTTRPTTERFRVQAKSSRSGKRLDYAVIDTSTTNPQPSLRIWREDDDDAARRWAYKVAALLNHMAEHISD